MSSIKKDRSDYWAGRPQGYGPAPAADVDPSKRPGWFVRLRNRYPSIVYLFTPRIWNDPNHFLPTDIEQEIYFRRRRLKILAVLLLLVLAVIFVPERIRSGVELYRARARADESLALLAKGDAAAAWDRAQVARALRPKEPAVLRALALSAGESGRSEDAVEAWRMYAATAPTAVTPLDRLKRAEILATTGRYGAARTVLKDVPAGAADRASEGLLSARISIGLGDGDGAVTALSGLLAESKQPPTVRLEVIRTIVESQIGDNAMRETAMRDLARLAREPGEGTATAVEYAARLAARKLLPPAVLSPEEIVRRLRTLPPALERSLLEFDLDILAQPTRLSDCVQDAQVIYNRQPTREALMMLSAWLLKHREWPRVLTLLTPPKAKEAPGLALARLNALMNSGQLREAKLEITSQRYQIDPLTQQVLLAQIVAAAGDRQASESRWNAAINQAGDDRIKLRQIETAALTAGAEVVAKRAAGLAAAAEAALQYAPP